MIGRVNSRASSFLSSAALCTYNVERAKKPAALSQQTKPLAIRAGEMPIQKRQALPVLYFSLVRADLRAEIAYQLEAAIEKVVEHVLFGGEFQQFLHAQCAREREYAQN
jgi:hypothetical protein